MPARGPSGGTTYSATAPIVVAGSVISVSAADGSNPGVISTSAQTMGAGIKTFTNGIVIGSGVATNTNAIDLGTSQQRLKGGASAAGYLFFDSSGTMQAGFCITAAVHLAHGTGAVVGGPAGASAQIAGSPSDSSTAVGVNIYSSTNHANSGAAIASFRNNTSVVKAKIGAVHGEYRIATHGADAVAGDSATVNAAIGTCVKDTSGATFTLTNSAILASTTKVIPFLMSSDLTATSVAVTTVSAGSCVFTFNAAPTSDLTFGWLIIPVAS